MIKVGDYVWKIWPEVQAQYEMSDPYGYHGIIKVKVTGIGMIAYYNSKYAELGDYEIESAGIRSLAKREDLIEEDWEI